MKLPGVLLVVLLNILISCDNASQTIAQESKANLKNTPKINATNEVYNVKAEEIVNDFMTWYNYTDKNIHLEQNFIGQDQDTNKIDKNTFLNKLATGGLIAIKIAKQDNVPVYQLYQSAYNEPDIQRTMVQMAKTAITLSAMEGKEIPQYNFRDLDGKVYDRNNTRGKILVLKCWFIHCVACVKEFPVLNELVERYKDRKDIQFISLASDSEEDLIAFLNKKPFRYAVIPGMENYMQNKLKVNAYPMHMLINKEGKIVKVSNSIEDLIPSLEKETSALAGSS